MKGSTPKKQKSIWFICLTSFIAATALAFATVVVCAYFSSRIYLYTDGDTTERFRAGMELNTFFDKINSQTTEGTVAENTPLGIVCADTSIVSDNPGSGITTNSTSNLSIMRTGGSGTTDDPYTYEYVYNSSATWGSASNPYIISKINHLQNLYVLQNAGYFVPMTNDGKLIKDGVAITLEEDDMPYFLVCTSIGTPAMIDGSDKTYEYIGNNEHPFIGFLGGAFVDGTVSVDGKSSDQSVIYKLTVETDDDVTDVGLFGHVGYIGDESSATDGKFTGSVSTVRDLLLYDVQVSVKDKSLWTAIVDATAHMFSFGDYADSVADTVYHENHHIGILAGHVEYSTIEYISVYYSSDDIAAISVDMPTADSSGTSANFYSVSGIIGYAYNMNCEHGNGEIDIDSGSSNDDIAVTGGGVGTGGGLESGSGRGYVSAADIFNAYNDSGEIVKCTINVTQTNPDGTTYETTTYRYGIVVEVTYDPSSGGSISGTLSDGTTPVTVQSSGSGYVAVVTSSYKNFFGITETNEQTWSEFVIHYNGEYYYYATSTNTLTRAETVETTGISLKYAAAKDLTTEEFTSLCTQYERSRIGSNITGWSQATDRYYFYDGVFTFALSDPQDTIDKTWDGEADSFVVGDDDASKWQTNTSEGNKAVVSYVKQVTTIDELKSAGLNGKKVYLIYEYTENNQTKEFLVTLADNSKYTAGNGEDACYTRGTVLQFVDSTLSEQLKQSVAGKVISSPISGMTNDQVVAAWDDYKILNVGDTETSTVSLSELAEYYSIDANYTSDPQTTNYKDEYGNDFSTGGNITVTAGTGISVNYQWDGYWIWYRDGGWYSGSYWYWYVFQFISASSGDAVYSYGSRTTTGGRGSPSVSVSDYFGTGSSQYGATVYTKDGYTGRVFYKNQTFSNYYDEGFDRVTGSSYAGYGSQAAMSVSTYTVPYYTADVTDDGTIYKYLGTGTALSSAPVVATTGTGANMTAKTVTINNNVYTLYTGGTGTSEGILLTSTSTSGYYTFSSTRSGTTYTLRMLKRAYLLATRFSILCASDTYAETASNFINEFSVTPSVSNNSQATVAPAGDGTFYISYTIDGNTRYLAYAAAGEVDNGDDSEDDFACFHGVSSKTDACKIYIYTVEGSQDVNYGYVTYEPSSDSTKNITYNADEYVLWPVNAYDGTSATSAYKPSTSSNYTTDTAYEVISLSDLYSTKQWKNSQGGTLTYSDLSSVFSLGEGISNINILNLWGGDSATNFNSEYIRAPIGTTGEEAYIPTGCVAFRVTKDGTDQKVRIIVAVPQSDYYYGQSVNGTVLNPGDVDYSQDYYMCMWNCTEAGDSTVTSINLSNCVQAFEIPRSNTYEPGSSASDSEYYSTITTSDMGASANSVKKYITIKDGNNTYRSYLNGSVVLVAYEFSVDEAGVYVLGSNMPCSIVYFSADSTASSGMDGTAVHKIGSVDFVYDNGVYTYSDSTETVTNTTAGDKILTVRDGDSTTSTTKDKATYYYPTRTLLYTDNVCTGTGGVLSGDNDATNGFANINRFKIYVRRIRLDGTTSELVWQAKGASQLASGISDAAYIQFVRYTVDADAIARKTDGVYSASQ